jgi:hypothetical protein
MKQFNISQIRGKLSSLDIVMEKLMQHASGVNEEKRCPPANVGPRHTGGRTQNQLQ